MDSWGYKGSQPAWPVQEGADPGWEQWSGLERAGKAWPELAGRGPWRMGETRPHHGGWCSWWGCAWAMACRIPCGGDF